MSNNNENNIWVWDNINPNIGELTISVDDQWNSFVRKFGENGEPGFREIRENMRSVHFFGHDNTVTVVWTTYRDEDGKLLAIHGCWKDSDGEQHPLLLQVHPEHQRKGIGTMMANFTRERYMDEYKKDGDPNSVFAPIKTTEAGAAFINKYVNNDYDKRNNDWSSYAEYVAEGTGDQQP